MTIPACTSGMPATSFAGRIPACGVAFQDMEHVDLTENFIEMV
jgi:hypothetical protein